MPALIIVLTQKEQYFAGAMLKNPDHNFKPLVNELTPGLIIFNT
jgi:hypothetical protein